MSVNILDYIPEAEHSNIRSETSNYDCHSALLEAIEDNAYVKGNSSASTEICFPPGTYKFGQAVDIKSTVILSSDTGSGINAPATLKFNENSDGLRFHLSDTIERRVQDPSTTGAQSSIVRGLTIVGGGRNKTLGSGILMRCRMSIEHCRIQNFAKHGVEIRAWVATEDGPSKGNANGWTITNSTVNLCGGHGVFIDGADANSGYSLRLNSTNNGGYGIYDSSFLGNTHIAAHTNNNASGDYFSDNANARTVFIGCYSENNQRSNINHPAMAIGGMFGHNDGTGQVISSQKFTEFRIQSKQEFVEDASGEKNYRNVITKLGVSGKPFMMIMDDKNDHGWAFAWRQKSRTWVMQFANMDRYIAFHLTTPETGVLHAAERYLLPNGEGVGTGKMILSEFLFKNASKRYETFRPRSVMERIEELERQVSDLSARLP